MSTATEEPLARRILLIISYQGGNFSGFAPQINAPTITNCVQDAIRQIDPRASNLTGASRTDAGVHARMQPVSFTTMKPIKTRGWVLALTQKLPKDIAVLQASYVPMNFDPRQNPIWKRYCYRVFSSRVEDAFLGPFAWRIGDKLDLELMKAEAKSMEGCHDFQAFRSIDDHRSETQRTLYRVDIAPSSKDPRCFELTVEGNRFMYNMVRIIAGTLVDVGRLRKPPGAAKRAIETGDRRELGMTAPPHGLTLEHVELQELGAEIWPFS